MGVNAPLVRLLLALTMEVAQFVPEIRFPLEEHQPALHAMLPTAIHAQLMETYALPALPTLASAMEVVLPVQLVRSPVVA